MEAFPCPLEHTVASALLLLNTPPSSLSPPITIKCNDSESLVLSNCKSGDSSTVTSEDCSSTEVRMHRLQMIADVAGSHHMKLKVVRKSRSKTFRISDCRKMSSGKSKTVSWGCVSETSEASSCLSSGSSSVCCARSCSESVRSGKKRENLAGNLKRKPFGSALLCSRAEAILGLLSDGCTSEVRIRQLLGDSPDTSKALRMLLKHEEVKRSGAGGRNDPYIYKKA